MCHAPVAPYFGVTMPAEGMVTPNYGTEAAPDPEKQLKKDQKTMLYMSK